MIIVITYTQSEVWVKKFQRGTQQPEHIETYLQELSKRFPNGDYEVEMFKGEYYPISEHRTNLNVSRIR